MYHTEDTIAAIATAAAGAAEGVIRLAGPNTRAVLKALVPPCAGQLHAATHPVALEAEIDLPNFASALPARIYWWPTHRSYTGQPSAELHLPGSPPLLRALLAQLCSCGARLAEPGEFTLRAFLSGRIDLTQAEAVLGIIDAADSAGLQHALAQFSGNVSHPIATLREDLLNLLADLEAGLDFVEEDLQFVTPQELQSRLSKALAQVAQLQTRLARRLPADELPRAVLLGAPNAGKSSLYNALVGDSQALVSELAGTTRDYLQAVLEINGVSLVLVDTAGQSQIASPLDSVPFAATPAVGPPAADLGDPDAGDPDAGDPDDAAQQVSSAEQSRATLRLWCWDLSQGWPTELLPTHNEPTVQSPCQQTANTPPPVRQTHHPVPQPTDDVWWIGTKADQAAGSGPQMPSERFAGPCIITSTRLGQGLAELKAKLGAWVANRQTKHSAWSISDRSRESLKRVARQLQHAVALAQSTAEPELIAADVRQAIDDLGVIVGATCTDDILDRLFSRFCVGK